MVFQNLKAENEKQAIPENIIKLLKGKWKNDLGSTLQIDSIDKKTGMIRGSYISPSGGGHKSFPLIGWVNTKKPDPKLKSNVVVLSFSVRWGSIGTITTWNGYQTISNNKPKIVMQWLRSVPNSNFIWDHVNIGQDSFSKI